MSRGTEALGTVDEEELTDAEAAGRAVAVLRDLAGQSRSYQGVNWAVSVHEAGGRKRIYATSNESMGYLPYGLRWHNTVRQAFDPTDPGMLLWRGLENPARIMVDHYHLRRSQEAGLRLVALYSTKPLGDEVAAFTTREKAVAPPEQWPQLDPEQVVSRIESVDTECAAQVGSRVPLHLRWVAAVALVKDALEAASVEHVVEAASRVAEPFGALRATLGELEAGRASSGQLEGIERIGGECRALAQSKRVPDHRLEPVDLDQPVGGWGDVSPPDEAFAYLAPFWATRVADMLAVMSRSRVDDRYLTKDQLGELAYEHYFVREQISATKEVLLPHTSHGEDG